MRKILLIPLLVVGILVWTAPAQADWLPGDGHKMHFPQLPDPNGWDIDVFSGAIYDDFRCSWTGPIEDIHFWASWMGDNIGQITWIDISLHGDVPANDPNNILEYSYPDSTMYDTVNRLWFQRFLPHQFVVAPGGFGDQGWAYVSTSDPQWTQSDHQQFFQVNIPFIDDPFIQQRGKIYWLGIHIGLDEPGPGEPGPAIGWKTSLDHWNDNAVYYYTIPGHSGMHWNELIDPYTYESIDMAFVITPEPTTLALLSLGSLAVLRRR